MKKFSAFLCRLLGTLIIFVVIASCLSVLAPQWMGYDVYHVVSGSMEPEIPVGSIVYVKIIPPEEIQENDIIAFVSEGEVVVHRAVRNQTVEGTISTKGDANEEEDMHAVPYAQVRGKVVYHLPYMGQMMVMYSTPVGKFYILLFLLCGALFNIVASRLTAEEKE